MLLEIPTTPLYSENEKAYVKKEESEEVWNWMKVTRKKWPLFIMLTNALIPFILTGLFFQQDAIATYKNWDLAIMSYSFAAFSIVHILGNLYWGPLIDRVGAINILPIVMLPLIMGLVGLLFIPNEIMAYIYMGLNGLSVGSNALSKNALWAEIYGTKSLGSIKGMDTNIIVIGTSAAPIIYGYLLDNGLSTQELLWALIGLSLIGLINYLLIFFKFRT